MLACLVAAAPAVLEKSAREREGKHGQEQREGRTIRRCAGRSVRDLRWKLLVITYRRETHGTIRSQSEALYKLARHRISLIPDLCDRRHFPTAAAGQRPKSIKRAMRRSIARDDAGMLIHRQP